MLYGDDFMFYTFVYAAILGLIPAFIAKNKGRSFGLWYLYGFGLFIVALIHSLVMEDYSVRALKNNTQGNNRVNTNTNVDVMFKFKDALDSGALTDSEYNELITKYKRNHSI